MNIDLKIKTEIYTKCIAVIDERIDTIKQAVFQVQESLLMETKSTAGDKHETGRAMLHLEQEKLGQQLAGIQVLRGTLKKIRIESTSKQINLGSLVYTTNHNYFIAVSAGSLSYKNDVFYAVSISTPIAKALLSKGVGDKVQFGNSTFTINKIV